MKALVNIERNEIIAVGQDIIDNGVNFCKTEGSYKTYYSKNNLVLVEFFDEITYNSIDELSYDGENIIYVGKMKWTRKDFMLMLITASEWFQFKELAKTDAIASQMYDAVITTEFVDLQDWATIQGLQYMYSKGIFTLDRLNQILTGTSLVAV